MNRSFRSCCLVYGAECWTVSTYGCFRTLTGRTFGLCTESMIQHTQAHHILAQELEQRLGLRTIRGSKVLRYTRHVARMEPDQVPR
jgi:hypothetical protein